MNTSAPALHRPSVSRRLGHSLDLEWSHLRSRPRAVRHAAGWAIVEGPLHDLDQILVAVGHRVAWTPQNETAMRRLVLRAAHDELAARVVIQRLLPGLLARVRRRRGVAEDLLDELLGAAWIGIRTFNPTRQASCVAAALVADADYRAFRMAWRRASSAEHPIGLAPDDLHDAEPPDSPRQILTSLFEQAAAAGVPDTDLDLIRGIIADTPTDELARAMNVTPRTVRNRRDRITDRLREVALAA